MAIKLDTECIFHIVCTNIQPIVGLFANIDVFICHCMFVYTFFSINMLLSILPGFVCIALHLSWAL